MGRSTDILIVSYRFPASQTPTSIILHQLFQHFPSDSCVVAAGPPVNWDESLRLPFREHRFGTQSTARWLERGYARSGPILLGAVHAWLLGLAVRYRPRRMYLHFPDPVFAIAGWMVARQLNIPHVVYFDITWKNNPGRRYRQMAFMQGRIARSATDCFAITDVLCEEVGAIAGREVQLLPHTITELPEAAPTLAPVEAVENVIHLAGTLYPAMNIDAVQRLVRVLPKLPGHPRLDIFGRNDEAHLRRYGLMQEGVNAGLVSRHELFAAQRRSRMLYLPFSFERKNEDMIRSNFPTRAMEYLVSGVPILVHAPRDSQLSRWAREHGWGLVIDEEDDDALRAGASRLLTDEDLRASLVAKAFDFVAQRNARTWSERLQRALGLTTPDLERNGRVT